MSFWDQNSTTPSPRNLKELEKPKLQPPCIPQTNLQTKPLLPRRGSVLRFHGGSLALGRRNRFFLRAANVHLGKHNTRTGKQIQKRKSKVRMKHYLWHENMALLTCCHTCGGKQPTSPWFHTERHAKNISSAAQHPGRPASLASAVRRTVFAAPSLACSSPSCRGDLRQTD